MNEEFYICECGCDAISVTIDDDYVCLSMWTIEPDSEVFSWKNRIRLIWQIIKRGHPCLDSIILSKDKAKELADEITRIIE